MKTILIFGTILLAQVSGESPAPEGFGLFFQNVLYVMGSILLAIWIWQAIRPAKRNPSLDVEMTAFAKKEHVDTITLQLPGLATKGELAAVGEKLGEQIDEMHSQLDLRRSQGIGNLHEKLVDLERSINLQTAAARERLSAVEKASLTQEAGQAEHGRKLDLILQRLPRK